MITLPVRRILLAASLVVGTVLGLHLLVNVLPVDFVGADTLGLVVHVDRERSVPTYLAAALLGLNALVLAAIAGLEPRVGEGAARRDRAFWLGLALLFALASMDEVATFHEMTQAPIRKALDLSGFLRFAWVIPVSAVLLLLAALYFRFWLRLPRPTRIGFALGAGLFALGALGLELPGGFFKEELGIGSNAYRIVSLLEEGLEFAGTIVLLGAFLGHLRLRHGGVDLRLR